MKAGGRFRHMYLRSMVHLRKVNVWRKRQLSGANFLIIAAAFVGLLGGLAGALLKLLTHTIEHSIQGIDWGLKYYILLIFPSIGILLTVVYISGFIRKSKFEHGLSQLIYSISKSGSKIPIHNTYSQIISSALTVGFGGSAGLEAPIAVTGAAIGSNSSKIFGLNYRDRTLLLACGAAAGIASVFNSPIAGMVLALELLLPQFSIPAFIPLLIASAVATVVSQFLSPEPLFVFVAEGWRFDALPYYILMALGIGYFCSYFTKLNTWVGALFHSIKNKWTKVIVGGLVLGILIAVFPALYGEGYITIQELLNGNYSYMLQVSFFKDFAHTDWSVFLFALLTLFGKSIAALVTVQAGGNGGSFGPSLVMGGFIGFVFAYGLNTFAGTQLNVTNFIVVGMAACLSGVMHAPLTGIFLIAEITGGYKLMVPLMIGAAIAYYVNRRHNKYSIYTQSLAKEGNLLSLEDRDRTLLAAVDVGQLLETDYMAFLAESKLSDNISKILDAKKNIFAVVEADGTFTGLVFSEQLLEDVVKLKDKLEEASVLMKDLAQPALELVYLDTPIYEVIQQMERKNIRTLPVLNRDGQFAGFITKNAIFSKYRQEINKSLNYF